MLTSCVMSLVSLAISTGLASPHAPASVGPQVAPLVVTVAGDYVQPRVSDDASIREWVVNANDRIDTQVGRISWDRDVPALVNSAEGNYKNVRVSDVSDDRTIVDDQRQLVGARHGVRDQGVYDRLGDYRPVRNVYSR